MILAENDMFLISEKGYTYAMYVDDGILRHAYYGAPVDGFVCNCLKMNKDGIDEPKEYSEFGRGDFKIPATVICSRECLSTDFRFEEYEISDAKPSIGMPALRGKKQTLAVILRDALLGLKLTLFYTPYEEGLVRSALLENVGAESVVLEKISSACFEFPRGEYQAITLCGRPNGERQYFRERLGMGIKRIASAAGITSHTYNNFLALVEEETEEEKGNVYGFNLVYSGNFNMECEGDCYSRMRVIIGENILYGGIELKCGEKYYTPEAVSVYSDEGLGGMSRKFHRLYRKHLLNPVFADAVRPIVINSWESIVFDVGEERLFEFIAGAKGLGIDMVVLDDGWFGKRNDDDCSLGDWIVDKQKLPNGLKPIIKRCKEHGMKFGLWFEPEAISPDSDLYRAHPDWTIGTNGRESVQIRRQLVLDFSKTEVVDYIFESMKKILENYEIDYVKWDMNRYFTDVPKAKTYREYMFGLYDLYERLTQSFPNILIEGCASGGGRFDAGILYYSPMIWTSDNTDAWCRAKIQYATSLCYPLQTMSNHVSDVPNRQTGRSISFETRGNVAKFGCLGYELHIAKASEADRELVKRQTAEYKKDANLILTGDLYRLKNPYTDEAFSQIVVSENKKEAILLYVRKESVLHAEREKGLLLRGLEENVLYEIEETGERFTGKQLMRSGLEIALSRGDYASIVYHIKQV